MILTVRDHGPGVPAAIAERIFDPFFTTKGVGKGLGLGLSISYNIIKDFGGSLSVCQSSRRRRGVPHRAGIGGTADAGGGGMSDATRPAGR